MVTSLINIFHEKHLKNLDISWMRIQHNAKITIKIYTKTSFATSHLRRSPAYLLLLRTLRSATFCFCINSSPQMSSAKLIQLFHGRLKSQLDSFAIVPHVYISEIQMLLCTIFINEQNLPAAWCRCRSNSTICRCLIPLRI